MHYIPFAALAALTFLAAPAAAEAGITKTLWGTTPDSRKMDIYTLSNANGMQVQISTDSGTLVSIRVPDRNGGMNDVLMSHPDLVSYLKDDSGGRGGRYGEVIGRYARPVCGAPANRF